MWETSLFISPQVASVAPFKNTEPEVTPNNLQVAELPEGFEPGSVQHAVKCSTTLATIDWKALSFSLSEKKIV